LDRSEERFHLLVDAVRDYAIFILDPDGIVSSWNVGAQRIKGYTESEIVGQHFSRFYTPEDLAAGLPQTLLAEARRSGRVEHENWRVRKDGTRFWANVVITALRDSSGELIGFAKVTRDLTERLAAEEDRRRRLAAEEAARLRAEFLSVAAHELKTPLAALRAMAQLTLRRYLREGTLSSERMQNALEVIDGQTDRLARLVERLLDVSRLESGHLILDRLETDLGALIERTVSDFRTRGDGRRIQLDLPAQPLSISVDALRVEQVLTNLIDNALKYSPADTPVTISVESAASGRATVTVADRGPGVPEQDRAHLFDRFFRSRAAGHTSGMGLGLYVSREIARLHGGDITFDFPEEGGTRVTLSLPAGTSGAAPTTGTNR
jgi:PAS domain S-box-containing protein